METKNKFGYFNILRFLGAVFIAIFLHWNDHILPHLGMANHFKNPGIWSYISKNSYVFVEMFFIISGFLFAKVYIDRIIKKDGITLKKFLTSRYIRIFPLVIISSIAMYFLHLMYFNKFSYFFSCGDLKLDHLFFDITLSGISTFGTGIQPLNGPLWYIGPLMLCYILAYFLTKLYKKNNNYLIYIIPIIIGIFIIRTNYNFFVFNIHVGRGLLSFFAGVLLGNNNLQRCYDNLSIKSKLGLKTVFLLLIILCIYVITNLDNNLYIGDYYDNILTYSLLLFPLIIIFLYDIKLINYIGNTKLFEFLGKISFSIYIWNFPIIITLVYLIKAEILNMNACSWEFMILNFVIHIIIATISYILIEKKISNKLKKNFN